jgi:hypothetical protein
MQIVTTTPFALIIFIGILVLGPWRGLWLFFLSMPFGSSAAINLAALGSLSVTDAGIIALWMSIIGRRISFGQLFGTLRLGQPGLALFLLLIVAVISGIFFPRVFSGQTEVFALVRMGGAAEIALRPLQPIGSNIGQIFRMLLSGSIFFVLATVFRKDGRYDEIHKALIVASVAHVVLAFMDVGSYAIGLPNLLDVIRTMNLNFLDNQTIFGVKRLSGGFPEPSSFSFYTVGLYAYWLKYWFSERTSRLGAIMVLLMAFLLLRSLASSALVGIACFTILFFAWHLGNIAKRKKATVVYIVLTMIMPISFGLGVVVYNLNPAFATSLDTLIFSKLSSGSGIERMQWNTQALQNFYDTFGIGAGIGSVRASSWLFTSLGSFGVLGTGLYLAFIIQTFRARPPLSAADTVAANVVTALQSAMLAVFIQSLLTKPSPNLETPFFAMAGLAVGLTRHMVLTQRAATLRNSQMAQNQSAPYLPSRG